MRGLDERSGSLFSYVGLEARVPQGHPLRAIREIVNAALADMDGAFCALYSPFGRASIAPEKFLRALLLQAFYSIRSERQLMERLDFDLLFRWFVGLGIDDEPWDHSTFSKNRDRMLDGDVAAKFLASVLAQPDVKGLLSSDHFSVDDRSRCQALPQRLGPRGQALLSRSCVDGKPSRAWGRRAPDARIGLCRNIRCARDDRVPRGSAERRNAWCRQGLRHG